MNNFKKIVYNCHKATFLIEKRNLKPLTLFERVELRIHLAGCSVCRTYQQQSILIGQMVQRILHTRGDEHKLAETDKQLMEERIEEEMNK